MSFNLPLKTDAGKPKRKKSTHRIHFKEDLSKIKQATK
jgi:hypothetical protein